MFNAGMNLLYSRWYILYILEVTPTCKKERKEKKEKASYLDQVVTYRKFDGKEAFANQK
jgi:hypothetical protein